MATFQTYENFARASAILPAAGAYDSSPTSIATNGFKQISFQIAYTRGAAGGAVTYKIEYSNTGFPTDFYQICEFQPPAIVAGSDVVIPAQRSEIKYQATGATIEKFMSPTFTVAGQFVRIVMKESGAVGTPGTAAVRYYLRGDA